MESCPLKTVISGTMGFGLGGVFGLFMASVCTLPIIIRLNPPNHYCYLDVLRLLLHPARQSHLRPTLAATGPHRLQGHGIALVVVGQELRHCRRALLRNRMLHRGAPREERSHEQCVGWMHHRWNPGSQGWPAGCGLWMRGFRGVLCGH